jgi:hypothetical protein
MRFLGQASRPELGRLLQRPLRQLLLGLVLGCQCHAAPVLASIETDVEQVGRNGLGECGDERVVELANEFRVAARQGVERAVGQDEGAAASSRFVSVLAEDVEGEGEGDSSIGRDWPIRRSPGNGRSVCGRRLSESVRDLGPSLASGCDGFGHDPSCEFILPRREGDAELLAAAAVALGRPSGSWSGASCEPDVVGFQQALRLEPVKVELGLMPGNTDRLRGLVTTDGFGLGADEPV